ncbi:hypothetical protein CFR76_02220 [Komagataeibacter swingsii]|uniref:Uncharacterized protein n=1 Tax=Komagataeibacter swingsii TaxID=215220 RepID=A0A2V4R1L3_9PROT|nr:hypothetical protein CFR76_02220 [Komagataeibacter swingsii]
MVRLQGNAHHHAAHCPDTLLPRVYMALVSAGSLREPGPCRAPSLPWLDGAGSVTLSSGLYACAENE